MKFSPILLLFLAILPLQADPLQFHGSSALGKLIEPYHDAIQQETGVNYDVLGAGNGRGLLDLAEHRADAAIIGGHLQDILPTLNATNKTDVRGENFVERVVYEAPMKFIVNASNPVTSLTLDQATQILTGQITNWNQLNGPDLKIIVLVSLPTGGARLTYTSSLLKNKQLTLTARIVRNGEATVAEVGKTPGGFTITDSSIDNHSVKPVSTDSPLLQSYGVVTLGDPNPSLDSLIAAFHKHLSATASH